jgi:secreted PhoX family phosphatase
MATLVPFRSISESLMPSLSRRSFLTNVAATSIAYAGLLGCATRGFSLRSLELRPDPARIFDLAPGLTYRIVSRTGDPMTDGFLTPGAPDGMAAFPDVDGRIRLVRNHELTRSRINPDVKGGTTDAFSGGGVLDPAYIYDRNDQGLPAPGGTTTLIYDPASGGVERSWLSLAGTLVNCAGGPTPWGSWLSCEEIVNVRPSEGRKAHGYVFEVPAGHEGAVIPVPLVAMGRFVHEAAAVDPVTGAVYMTEDTGEGLFYRFLPEAPGKLARGGQLQALAVKGAPGLDLRNWEVTALAQGETMEVHWIDLAHVDNPDGDLSQRGQAAGAAIFTRGEGCAIGDGEIFFVCSDGGPKRLGQIWRYRPSSHASGRLDLFMESHDPAVMETGDNVVVTPWGDIIIAEDSIGENRLMGVRPDGHVYTIGRHAYPYKGSISEVTGPCFSPDGGTLFFNIQRPGITLAISGDWSAIRRA